MTDSVKYSNSSKDSSANSKPVLLTLTESCIKQMQKISSEGHLRIVIEGGGCSGYQYKFEFDQIIAPEDMVLEDRTGVKVLIDEDSYDFVRGATIDYQEELIRSAFCIIDNPKQDSGCSCGASFSLKI